MKYPDEYRLWVRHVLAEHRPDFYARLSEAEQVEVWSFIEQNYLLKYKRLLRVEFEFGSSGLWVIPFPGSVSMGGMVLPEDYGVSPKVAGELEAWVRYIDDNFEPWPSGKKPDWEKVGTRGLEVAKKVKAEIGSEYYLERRLFRELAIHDGEVIELPIPSAIERFGKKE